MELTPLLLAVPCAVDDAEVALDEVPKSVAPETLCLGSVPYMELCCCEPLEPLLA